MHSKTSCLVADGVSVSFGDKRVLDDISFELEAQKFYALVGVNGAGKSTLFKAMLGLVPMEAGRFSCFGLPMQRARQTGQVAYIPQYDAVDAQFPVQVYDIVMMGRYNYQGILRRPSAHDHKLCEEALTRVGMLDYAKRNLAELSGGQRKRVFIARALAQEANMMLLDEVFAGVDKKSELAILEVLQGLVHEGKSMLVAVHDLRQARQYFDAALVLNKKVLGAGNVDEVLSPELIARAYDIDTRFAKELL